MSYSLRDNDIALEQLGRTILYSDSTESIGFITRIFDTCLRMVNNFKTILRGFRHKFKRSELKAYHDSHIHAYKHFVNTHYFNPSLSVPIPSGMKVPYIRAVETLDSLYTTLRIEDTVKALSDYFTSVSKAGHILPTGATLSIIGKLARDETEKTLQQIFTADKTLEVKLDTVISSFEEVLSVDERILTYETVFQKVDSICSELDKVEKLIDSIITGLEKQETTNKAEVQSLYELVYTASVQLDMYGVILAEMQRVEHNFVIVLRRLVEAS